MRRAIIPSDNESNLAACVAAILKAHPKSDPASILVPTGKLSPEAVRQELKGLSFIRDDKPFVYGRRVNLAIRALEGADAVLLGDDVVVPEGKPFSKLAAEGALRILAASVRGRVGPWWQYEGRSFPEVPFVSFICVFLPAILLDVVGPLEEGFRGYGYEDTDYCIRARRAGFSCGVCGSVVVEHSTGLLSEFMRLHGERILEMEAEARVDFLSKLRKERS